MTHRHPRPVFMLHTVLAVITALLATLTILWPDWIEALSGVAPDRHNGSFEWFIVVGLAFSSAICTAVARHQWLLLPRVQP